MWLLGGTKHLGCFIRIYKLINFELDMKDKEFYKEGLTLETKITVKGRIFVGLTIFINELFYSKSHL